MVPSTTCTSKYRKPSRLLDREPLNDTVAGHLQSYKPAMGDFVLVARLHGLRTKMSANSAGPHRVVQIYSDFTVQVEHLSSYKCETVHICRVRYYIDSELGNPVQM